MIQLVDNFNRGAKLKVIGVGGCGGNAVDTMIEAGLDGVEFIAANTDSQALMASNAAIKVQLGTERTKGLGAGANPEQGREAAMEDLEQVRQALEGADMVFITAGMGGGTGTGGSPVIAEAARASGALVVAVVTKPFSFEGQKKMRQAEEGLNALRDVVDTVITIPNERLMSMANKNTTLQSAFKKADEVLYHAVRGISDVIKVTGLVNVDFADIKSIMSEMGHAIMGSGMARGENRGREAAQQAIASPLLENISVSGAKGVLINITGSSDLSIHDVHEASSLIQEEAHEDANIIFGAVVDESLDDEVRVTVIATGFGAGDDTRSRSTGSALPKATVIEENLTLPLAAVNNEATMVPPAMGAHPAPSTGELRRAGNMGGFNGVDEDTYDTPTFLRKQAD